MKLFFRKYGEGIPVFIFHGLFGQSDNWATHARKIAEHGYSVFTMDLRNHGLSPHDDEFTYESMAHDIYETLQSLNLYHPILVGHSMGAKAILMYEKLFSGTARALVPVDMALRKYEGHHQMVLQALHAVDLEKIKTRNEADELLKTYIPEMAVRQFLLKNLYRSEQHPERLRWRFNLQIITEYYSNILKEIPFFSSNTPALLIYGEKSGYILHEDLKEYSRRFNNFESCCIAGAGHWVHAEKPEEVLDALVAFIKKIST